MRKITWVIVLLLVAAISPSRVSAATAYSLFGSASYFSPGNNSNRDVDLLGDATATPQVFSGVDFTVPAGLAIGSLNMLSTDYNFVGLTSCGNGSPRFGITLSGNPNFTIFVYIGPSPNYTGCAPGWTNTGNLLTPTSLVDDSQLGGSFYTPWATVQARYSGQTVIDIFIVSDNGPGAGGLGSQEVQVDNTNVNGTIYTYEPTTLADCKNGAWQTFTFAPGPFANQGACVSYFATHK